MPVQWWCSASTGPWTWEPIAYPGVWLVEIVIAFIYWRLVRRSATPRGAKWAGWLGVASISIALDWPLGQLAASYLASAHAVQFLIVALIAPPLLLIGVRHTLTLRAATAADRPVLFGLLRRLSHPLPAAIAFNIIVIATHVPRVNDAMMRSQLGAFGVDMAWLVSGLWFWWPLLVHIPSRPWFATPLRMLYLFLGTLAHTGIAMVMLVHDHPMYGVYELAPRAMGMSALTDIKVAGGIMELGGAGLIFGVLTFMFFTQWSGGSGAENSRTVKV